MKFHHYFTNAGFGLFLVMTAMLVSGVANFVNKLAMTASGQNAFQYTTLKNILAAVLLSLIITAPALWRRLSLLSRADWGKLCLIGLIGGSVPFLLFFKGLSLTSAVSASLIHKTLFIWVAVLAWPMLKEKISSAQFLALGVLLAGNAVLSGFKFMAWGAAESMILIATWLWSVETVLVKKFLNRIDSAIMAWGRMFFGAIFLLIYLGLTDRLSGLLEVKAGAYGWLIAVSVLLFVYVFTWFGALKRFSAGAVTCFLVLASPVTTFLNAIFAGQRLDGAKIFGVAAIFFGVWLFWVLRRETILKKSPIDFYAR